jgi:hypothetical protein
VRGPQIPHSCVHAVIQIDIDRHGTIIGDYKVLTGQNANHARLILTIYNLDLNILGLNSSWDKLPQESIGLRFRRVSAPAWPEKNHSTAYAVIALADIPAANDHLLLTMLLVHVGLEVLNGWLLDAVVTDNAFDTRKLDNLTRIGHRGLWRCSWRT